MANYPEAACRRLVDVQPQQRFRIADGASQGGNDGLKPRTVSSWR